MKTKEYLQIGTGLGVFLRKLLCLLLALSMVMPWTLTAQGLESADGQSQPHTEHTPECGYRAAIPGAPCRYDTLCDKECKDTDGDGITDHARDCAFTLELQKELCDKECKDTDSDGLTDHAPDCAFTLAQGKHTHNAFCGYIAADAGAPCAFQIEKKEAAVPATEATTPVITEEATTPATTEEATVPATTEEATVPETTEEATVPAITEEATVPETTGEAAVPETTEEATIPETTEEATVPETTEEATVPETTEEATVPETTEEATVPETTEEATVPEETPVQQIQALIEALPEHVTGENRDAVTAQLQEILALYTALTEAEQEQIDMTPCVLLQGELDAANQAELLSTGAFTVEGGTLDTDYSYANGVLTIKSDKQLIISGTSTSDRIAVASDVSANITLKNVSIDVSGIEEAAAFKIADDSAGSVTVTLEGTNTLKSGKSCAGLQKNGGSGTLTIGSTTGGTLDATGGQYSAGIGAGGVNNSTSNITISGGTVTATGGEYGAGIGGGCGNSSGGNASNITVTGGTVTASGGRGGAGIGGAGYGGSSKVCNASNITVSSGTVIAKGGAGASGIGGGPNGKAGNITISGGKVEATGGAQPGSSSNSNGGAGIGGRDSGGVMVTISGGIVTATGDNNSAGIGGSGYSASQVVIDGGTVTAKGGSGGAGIGGSYNYAGTVTINNGDITAEGSGGGAAIGGGGSGGSGTVTIRNGKVKATASSGGAGIGGGSGNSGNVTISGGTVTATIARYGQGAGIGSGSNSTAISEITISGGTVTASGSDGYHGAGIGGGMGSSGGKITISGGTVTATGGKNGGAGIGDGGNGGTGGTFTTGENGSAFIDAASISDVSNQESWSGVFFLGSDGQVYGNPTLKDNATIPSGKNLTVPSGTSLEIPDGVTLTNTGGTLKVAQGGSISGEGTISGLGQYLTEKLTEDMIFVDLSSDGTDQTEAIKRAVKIAACGQEFTADGWTLKSVEPVDGSNHMQYKITYTHTSGETVTKTVTLSAPGTALTVDSAAYECALSDTFTITATVTPTQAAPGAGPIVVCKADGTEISRSNAPDANGNYTLTVTASDLGVGGHTLTVASTTMPDVKQEVAVTVGKCRHVNVENGKCSLCGELIAAIVEDDSGTTYYSDITSAWNYAKGKTATVTMQRDQTITHELALSSGNLKLTMPGNVKLIGNDCQAITVSGGTLSLEGCTIEVLQSVMVSSCVSVSRSGAVVDIKDCTMLTRAAASYAVDVSGGTVNIYSGTFQGMGNDSFPQGGGLMVFSDDVNVSLYGGTFIGAAQGQAIAIDLNDSLMLGNLLVKEKAYKKAGTWITGNDLNIQEIDGTVEVLTLPALIVQQPKGMDIYGPDTDKSLSIAARSPSGDTLTYQWYRVGTGSGGADEAINGATEATYTLPQKKAVGTHQYYCTVSADDYSVDSETVAVNVYQSGTQFVGDGTVKTYKDGEETSEFTYGETITVTAKPTPTGQAPTKASSRLRGAPTAGQMALYYNDTQVSEAVSVGENGLYTMTVAVKDLIAKGAGYGQVTLTAKYAETAWMDDAEQSVTVTLQKATLSITDATLKEKIYDGTKPGNVAGVTFSGVVSGENLALGTDYTATAEFTDVNAGTGTKTANVKVTLTNGNYTFADGKTEAAIELTGQTIQPKKITPAISLTETSFMWNDNAKEPAVNPIKDGETILGKDVDYTVAYADNTLPGEATVTVTGKGNYSFTATANFTIVCPHPGMGDDGNCTVCHKAIAATVEVGDGTTYYTDIVSAWSFAQGKTATVTMRIDQNVTEALEVSTDTNLTLQMLNGVTLTGSDNVTVSIHGTLTLVSGTIVNTKYNCGLSLSNWHEFTAELYMTGGTVDGIEASGGTVGSISGGRIEKSIQVWGDHVGSLLAPGYAYKQNSGWVTGTALSSNQIRGPLDVLRIPVEITDQPKTAQTAYGVAAETLTVTAKATTDDKNITYQWYYEDGTPVAGQTTATLTVPDNLTLGDHKFYCAVTCGGYTVESETGTVTVNKATLTSTDVSATVGSVKQPEALGAVQKKVTDGTGYTVSITWTPEADKDQYGFNTEYTATLTLTPDGNHTFGTIAADGWSVADGEEGAKTLTKTFQATRKEKITAVTAPTNQTLDDHQANAAGVIAKLPAKVTVNLEGGGTAELSLSWSCDTYVTTPNYGNAFTWTVEDVGNYDQNKKPLTGSITVTNPDPDPVTITATTDLSVSTVSYSGSTIDVSKLFTIDENAGKAAYSIAGGSGTGSLEGSALTVTKAGTFTIAVNTEPEGIYAAGTATAILTVNKGTGTGSVTMEGWIYGETAKDPVPDSDTNGIDNVTYTYSVNGTTIAKPTQAGTYTVTAAFAATDLYDRCTASADFTIEPKPITVTIAPGSVVEGTTFTGATAEVDKRGLAEGDAVPTLTLTYTRKGETAGSTDLPKDAGTYTVTASIDNKNYVPAQEATAEFIVRRPITVTIGSPAKAYGDKDPEFTYKVTEGELLDGIELKITLERKAGENIGDYPITAPNAKKDNPHYEITVVEGKLTVAPKDIKDAEVVLGRALIASGKPQTQTIQSVTVKDGHGKSMDVTYTVTGNTQTGPGEYEMTITGIGNFTGTRKQPFAIAKMPTGGSNSQPLGAGTISEKVSQDKAAPTVTLVTPRAKLLAIMADDSVITAQDLVQVAEGTDLEIIIKVEDSASVPTADQRLIKAILAKGCKVGSWLDISLYKQLGDGEPEPIHETSKPITLTVKVPTKLLSTKKNETRTYQIVRCHDGKAEILDTTYQGGKLTFETDRFSSYAIVYTVKKLADPTSPRTGDDFPIGLLVTVMLISAAGIGTLTTVNRKKKK